MESFINNPYVSEFILVVLLIIFFGISYVTIKFIKKKGEEAGIETKGIVKLVNTICNVASEKAIKKFDPKDEDLQKIHNGVKENLSGVLNKEVTEEKKEDPKPIKEETK